MKVVLDARPLSHPQAGGFRSYVRALLQGFTERGIGDIDLLLYVDRTLNSDDQAFVPPGAGVRMLTQDRVKTDLLWFQRAVREDSPDLVHGTMNYLPKLRNVQTTLTVHDAMGVKNYPWDAGVSRTPRERFINRYWSQMTRLSARTAQQIVTDSHDAASELTGALRLPEERFTVIYPGLLPARAACRQEGDTVLENSILAIASPDSRKNLDILYRALTRETQRFPNGIPPRLDLVCSSEGAARRAEQGLVKYGIQNARLLRALDDTALRRAYASAGVFVWSSWREGFGLPPLEAMICGCPVAASRAPAMPEVLGDAPVYFDPNNSVQLAEAVACLLRESPEARQARLLSGRERAGRFTCRRMADETAALWQRVGDSGS